jgi:L-asparaginase
LPANHNIVKVAVLGLGGTIAMTRTAAGGVAPALSAAELVAAVSGLSEVAADLEVIDVRRLPGASLTVDDVRELYAAAEHAYAAGADGVVVTQGTDTIEETAYLLDLWHGGAQPLIVTGAMRNPAQAGHDGPANLLAAIRTAVAPQARNRGVMVVIADQIHAAARVRKTHATSLCAFTSPDGGPLGQLVEDRPWFAAPPGSRLNVPLPRADAHHQVGLIVVSLGDQGEMLHGISGRLDGLVVAGMGVGHVPAPLAPVLQDIAAKIPVILATRTGAGPVLTATYAFPGSERDLQDRGLIPAGLLDPLKARILLLALLRAGTSREAIAASFTVAGGYSSPGRVTNVNRHHEH